ncbi:MAG: hypothetical protein NC300_09785 [Bacteroidales bacterium]|nr:hypothetical protein [Clostridium sp.]MCM1204422.1 hypothetical protein [Bacteroidales bacterium]
MAKKKSNLGKLLAFTTTVAAIGGTCYVFRDKIKESPLYKASVQKCLDAFAKLSGKDNDEDDDFFFDDEDDSEFQDVFAEDTEHNREYTSISINAKDESDKYEEADDEISDDDTPEAPTEQEVAKAAEDTGTAEAPSDTMTEIFAEDNTENNAEDNIPTISFSTTADSESDSEDTVSAYENEGLSDVSEDPDVLEEQDKLDF